MKSRKRYSVIISAGVLSITLAACGGSSGGDNDSSGTGSNNMGSTNNDGNGSNEGSTASFNLTTQYNNGFVADILQQTNAGIGFNPPRQTFTIDTAANIVTDGLIANSIPDIYYDEQGRATEQRDSPSSTPYVFSYNANGTIASVTRTRTSSTGSVTTDFTSFNYDGDRLTGKSRTRTRDGESSPYGGVTYTYNANGTITGATINRVVLGFVTAEEYTFQTDSLGRITEVNELDDGAVDTRHTLAYDANNNVIRHDIYASNGQLFIYREYSYVASPEPAVNLPGAMMSLNDIFLPEDDLFTL